MIRLWVFDSSDKLVKRLHFLLPKCGEPGFYRSVGSYEAQRRALIRKGHNTPGNLRYSMDHTDPVTEQYVQHVPLQLCASIWDAYKVIGYDYKSRKFKATT